jgi:hypothetical protein
MSTPLTCSDAPCGYQALDLRLRDVSFFLCVLQKSEGWYNRKSLSQYIERKRNEMVPAAFLTYFAACAGAGGALIGLLFVAISIVPEDTNKNGLSVERRVTANNTFTAMINAFFISLAALIPSMNVGFITLILGLIGLSNSLGMDWLLIKDRSSSSSSLLPKLLTVITTLGLYGYECYIGLQLIISPKNVDSIVTISVILLGIYGWGIVKAWELIGLNRFGLFNVFLNLFHLPSVRTGALPTTNIAVTSNDTVHEAVDTRQA